MESFLKDETGSSNITNRTGRLNIQEEIRRRKQNSFMDSASTSSILTNKIKTDKQASIISSSFSSFTPSMGSSKSLVDLMSSPFQEIEINEDHDLNMHKKKLMSGNKVSMLEMFRFASSNDKLCLFLGIISSLGLGMVTPLSMAFFGSNVDGVGFGSDRKDVLKFVYLGICASFFSIVMGYCLTLVSLRQADRIKRCYLEAVLNMDMEWFDKKENSAGAIVSRLESDTLLIKDGLGEDIGKCVQSLTQFFAGFILAYVYEPKLAAVLTSAVPLFGISVGFMIKAISSATIIEQESYSNAGGIACEGIENIHTIKSFNAVKYIIDKFSIEIDRAAKSTISLGKRLGLSLAFMKCLIPALYALAFYYGGKLILDSWGRSECIDGLTLNDKCITTGTIMTVFFCILIGTFSVTMASDPLQNITAARGAAFSIYGTIIQYEELSKLSNNERSIKEPKEVGGACLSFKQVHFAFPSNLEVPILRGLDLEIKAGESVALVGSSGCGKSTLIQLLLRFYDAKNGFILLDGVDITKFNKVLYRHHIAYVQQEPLLFDTTIAENIALGLKGVRGKSEILREEIEEAAKKANAHDFVNNFPKGYDTIVGSGGSFLSGGQKQRIAIARALIRKPRILVLDEATSALDSFSEEIVQKSIENLMKQQTMTTISIAHRLSTVKNFDKICVVKDGIIAESGTHDELMSLDNGAYHTLVKMQHSKTEQTAKNEEISLIENLEQSKDEEEKQVINEEDTNEQDDAIRHKYPFKRIITMCKEEWPFFILGGFFSVIEGGISPANGIITGKLMYLFFMPLLTSQDQKEFIDELNFYCFLYLFLIFAQFLGKFVQVNCFQIGMSRFTFKLRLDAFKSILNQEIAFFDFESQGELLSLLQADTVAISRIMGVQLGGCCAVYGGLIVALTICFFYSWKFTIIIFATIPILISGSMIRIKKENIGGSQSTQKNSNDDAFAQSRKVAAESVSSIRNVMAFSLEANQLNRYHQALSLIQASNNSYCLWIGLANALSNGVPLFIYAIIFFAMFMLSEKDGESPQNLFIVQFTLLSTVNTLAENASFMSKIPEAKKAALRLFAILDRKPKIQDKNTSVKEKQHPYFQSAIEFKDVYFTYPSRPEVTILNSFNLRIRPGQMVAIVGESGCGKSTTIHLLERFYDPCSQEMAKRNYNNYIGLKSSYNISHRTSPVGQLLIDGNNLRDLDLYQWRQEVSIVSQEPVLFRDTIEENIRFGRESLSDEDIRVAAKQANAHAFIMQQNKGYQTIVGGTSSKLSGGQKQRIAIARAIVRKPRLLLLDEATSALDNKSEAIVQKAIDNLLGKSIHEQSNAPFPMASVVIAHRLSTIRNADSIIVVDKGVVVENGTYTQLMNKENGRFRAMQLLQKV